MNYSFWADEALISEAASRFTLNNMLDLKILNSIPYQKLYVVLVAFFFKIFGVGEFVARLPSMLSFLIGGYIIFLIGKKASNTFGGALSSFLYSLSHLNLAYATQAKPYIFIELILLLIVYSLNSNRRINHFLIIILCTVGTILHHIGVFLWIIYFFYIFASLKRTEFKFTKFKYWWLILCLALAILVFIFPIGMSELNNRIPFGYNHMYQIVKLFAYKYFFISLSSILGFIWSFKKLRELELSILAYMLILVLFVAFFGYIFNIRYVLSVFGIMFLYFGIFWAKVGEKYDSNFKFKIFNFKVTGKAIIPLAVMLVIYITGYKIVRGPQAYYNPNIDKYGDIQIANYKDFYAALRKKFPNYRQMYMVNDTFDAEYWYIGRYSNAYFMKFAEKPYKHGTAGVMIYGSLADFKKMIKKHPQGLLIMEDWQSFLPDDIKEYAKKNLHLEFRVESLKEAPNDPWPLALYSWGLNNK